MPLPANPKIYHILHVDRLHSVIADGFLYSDAIMSQRSLGGTTIGMSDIKQRRLTELTLASHPDLRVGECVPFYYCPRSIMLYKIHKGNDPDLSYKDGQQPILHLELDLHSIVDWAAGENRRWAITKSNAGSYYFEDFNTGHLE
jgi:ssDNA thymidine ADP-ribosyltransferase, DarT